MSPAFRDLRQLHGLIGIWEAVRFSDPTPLVQKRFTVGVYRIVA